MPVRERFLLSSEFCEFLYAFSLSEDLDSFADNIGLDLKAASKKLEMLREKAAVVDKVNGTWIITPFGHMVAKWTADVMATQKKLLRQQGSLRLSPNELDPFDGTGALILIGVQKGFDDPVWGQRNNPEAMQRIQVLLSYWRDRSLPIYHVAHTSGNPDSPLRKGSKGAAFMDFVHPRDGEDIIEKTANSAFVGTDLEKLLRKRRHTTLVLAGMPANQCIDATTRMAADLGFTTFVVADATVSFERVGVDGRRLDASLMHRATLANLNQEFGVIVDSKTVIDKLGHPLKETR